MSRQAAAQIIQRLRQHGHVAVLAGGCVRDRLLGVEPKDHDVATDAPPRTVQQLFRRSQPVGETFGVVLVYPSRNRAAQSIDVGRSAGQGSAGIEVATFRTEGVYSDGRRPDDVTFSDIEHDAQRRDFTINGLFEVPGELADPQRLAEEQKTPPPVTRTLDDGSVILDYVGGLADLESQTLRAIGDPARRFAEDYLRMLRAVRFTARLSFTLDPTTADAIRANAASLKQIARERIGDEVRRMLTGPNPASAMQCLTDVGLNGSTFGEPYVEQETTWLERLGPAADFATRLDTLIGERRHGRTPAQLRDALKLSNDEFHAVRENRKISAGLFDWPSLSVAARKRLASRPRFDQALLGVTASDADRELLQNIYDDIETYRQDGIGLAPDPLLDGGDLIRLGLKPGPVFKTLLDDAYDAQLEGGLTTHPQALNWVQTRIPST